MRGYSRTLVSRFRRSHEFAARPDANFGIMGTLALYSSSAVSNLKFLRRTRRETDRNFKFTALVAGLTVFLLAAGPAPAQSPAPDAMTAARELVVTMRTADQFKALMPMIVQGLKPAIVQNRPEVARDLDAIMPLMLEGMSARVNEIVDEITALYARTFSVEELNAITAFYRGPVGQKFLLKLPAITQESMVIGQKFGQSVAGEMQGRIVEELRKRGHKL
jgi:uncharacterized protein